ELQALYERTHGSAPPISKMMRAGTRLHLGWLQEAKDTFEHILQEPSIGDYQPLQETPGWTFEAQGWTFEVHCRAWQAHALWCLGYPDRAFGRGREAIQLANDLGQPFNQSVGLTYFAMLRQFSAEPATARAQAEAAYACAVEYKAPYYVLWSRILAS